MLQSLHDKLKGWISGIIIGVISIVFVLWGISYYFEGARPGNESIAKVGKASITDGQLQQQLNQLRQNLAQQGTTDLNDPKYQKMALSQLINQQLQTQGSLLMGVRVSSAVIDQQITQLPFFQENGHFSKERFDQFLQSSGYSLPMLRSMLKDNMLSSQVTSGLIGSDFVLPGEEAQAFSLLFQKRLVEYVKVPYSKINSNLEVTDQEIKTYYDSHQDEFIAPEEVKLKYIELTLSDVEKRISVTDSQIQAYYDQNKSQWTVTNADKTQSVKPLKEVKSEILNKLKKQQAEVLYSSIGNEMANDAYQFPDSLDQAAKKAKVSIKESTFFTMNSGTGIATNPQVRQAAFSNDVLKNKYNSDVINLSATEAVIVRLDQYKPKKELDFNEVKGQIKDKLAMIKSKEWLNEEASKSISLLNSGKTVSEIANTPVEWDKDQVSRTGANLPEDLVNAIMSIALNNQYQSKYELVEGPDALYIYHITGIKEPASTDENYYQMKIQSESMAKNIQFSLQYQGYINYLKEVIPVKVVQ